MTTNTTTRGRIESARQHEYAAALPMLEQHGDHAVHFLVGWIEAIARDGGTFGYETPAVRLAKIRGVIDAYKHASRLAIERLNAVAS